VSYAGVDIDGWIKLFPVTGTGNSLVQNRPFLPTCRRVKTTAETGTSIPTKFCSLTMTAKYLSAWVACRGRSLPATIALRPDVQVSRTKEKLYEYQEELERQHREEEDRLMAQFHQERLVEAENMQKEFDSEWEQQLKALTDQFDSSSAQKKKDRTVSTVYTATSHNDLYLLLCRAAHAFSSFLNIYFFYF